MSSSLRDTKLVELCTPSISYDKRIQAACTAFDKQMFEIIDDTGQVIMIPNIMNLTDEKLVDILAWQFHVDFYDKSRDLEFRKRLVQMSIIWHKTKGTISLVQEVIDTYWRGGAHIEEWYEYMDPLPPNYPNPGGGVVGVGEFMPNGVDETNNRITFIESYQHADENQDISFLHDLHSHDLPAPLIEGLWYYARNVDAHSFQVSTLPNGPVIDILTSGSREGTWGANAVVTRIGGRSWHDRYLFRVVLEQAVIEPEDERDVLALIDRYKPVSRWCEGIFRVTITECDIGVTGMVLRFVYRSSDAPDDWSPGPEPVSLDVNAYFNELLLAPEIEIEVINEIKASCSQTLGAMTLSSQSPGPPNPHIVHFVYLVPSDKTDRASARILQMGYELQRWMRFRMGNGRTFRFVQETYHTSHNAAWYSHNYPGGGNTSGNLTVGAYYHIVNYQTGDDFTNVGAGQNASGVFFRATGTTPANWSHGSLVCDTFAYYWTNSLNDLAAYAGGGFYQFYHTWFVYVDCNPTEGQIAGGTGGGYTSGCCLLGEYDLDALLGINPQWTVCREIGGAGHEYLHTHSAPHAESEYWTQSIMGVGYGIYPDCILQPSLIAMLNANPFYTIHPPEEMHEPTLCPFSDDIT